MVQWVLLVKLLKLNDTEPCPLHLAMLQLRPDTPYLTIARLASLLALSLYFSCPQSATPSCSLHDNIHTLILLWQRWPLSPSFIPSFISSLAKICPIPTGYGEANVNMTGESGGWERDRHGNKDSERHDHMHMYEYTHMHNPRKEIDFLCRLCAFTLSHSGA